jgi:protocatechuate 3,4-dioxygenase beta subunit
MGSRNALVTVFLVLGLLAGGGAWFLTRDDGAGERTADLTASTGEPLEPAATRADLATPAGVLPAIEAPLGASERMEVAAEKARQKAPAAPEGPRLTGRVVDPSGLPIAGATVIAGARFGPPLDLLETAREIPGNRARATTDDLGRYELRGLEETSLRMLVRASGFAPHERDDVSVPAGTDHELAEVVLEPGAILQGIVVDPLGQGIAGTRLYLTERESFGPIFLGDFQQRPSAVTDAAGRFRIDEVPLGSWSLRADSPDHPIRVFEGLAERAGEILERRLELERGDVIAGQAVRVPEGEREKLVVRASPKEAGRFFGFSRGASRQADVAADGTFQIKGLGAEQDYLLQLRLKQTGGLFFGGGFGESTRSERVSARSGSYGVEILYQPEAAVTFQVVDGQSGAPLEALSIQSGFRWLEPLLGDDGRPLSEFPEGRVRVGNLRPDTSPSALELEVSAVGYQTHRRTDVSIFAGTELDLGVIRLDPLPLVEVTVLDKRAGTPIAGAEVSLSEEEPVDEGPPGPGGFRARTLSVGMHVDGANGEEIVAGEAGRVARTDEQGIARLTSMEGKRGVLRVTREGYAPVVVGGIAMARGAALKQVIELGPGGSVLVRVADDEGRPVSGARIEHRAPSSLSGEEAELRRMLLPGGGGGAVTDSAGEARLTHLEPGRHSFRLARSNGRTGRRGDMVFTFAGDGEDGEGWDSVEVAEEVEALLTLVKPAMAALVGRVRESGVELTGASLRLTPDRGGRDGGFQGPFPGMGAEDERSDASGRYEIADVETGKYILRVSHPKRRMPAEFPLELTAGENRFDVELSISSVEGRVTDAAGKPLAGIEVRVGRAGGGGQPRRVAMLVTAGGGGSDVVTLGDDLGESARTDADGRYSLRGVASDVEIVVTASGDGVQAGRSDPLNVAPDETRRNVDLKLELAGSVRVEAFQPDGSPAEFAMVRANYLDTLPEGSQSQGAEPKFAMLQGGSTELQGLRPGRWSVTANLAGPSGGEQGEPKEVVVKGGEQASLRFDLP